ncbi:unnamed protein product [Paramecium pentaurelia]|uniref:Tubulin/FtsZ GTPase domain-containing protein n=1 Tax=Paramecium pentaurelia TaxID=43138 RepID=A0A8S1TD35_9CILI|nr:unnamed protein product [Paramecium pentaurelia]
MGTLLLNLGQCGNQLALQMFNLIDKSSMHEGNMFLRRRESNIYHTILVDTEPKILKPIVEDRKLYSHIDVKNVLYYQYGRGNNWGLGYLNFKQKSKLSKSNQQQAISVFKSSTNEVSIQQYCQENEQIVEQIINQARKEIEKTDYFLSISTIMSLAGGTGSGLGSRVIQEFSDIFQEVHQNVIAIFPNKTGETPLQHYNTLLSSAHIQQYADSIIYFENDRIYQMLSQIGSKQIDKSVDLSNVNEYIGSCLMNLFWINDNYTNARYYQDLLSECCITEGHKFIEVVSAPFTLFAHSNLGPLCTWEELIKSSLEQYAFEKFEDDSDQQQQIGEAVTKSLQIQSVQKKGETTLNLQSVFRSENVFKTLQDSDSHMKFLERKINSVFNPIQWNPDAVQLHFINEKSSVKGHDQKMNVTLINSTKIIPILKNVSKIAYQKYRSGAYLHWYWKYGLENQDFDNAFESLQKIQDDYNYMVEY